MAEINFQISSRATILLGRENIAKAEGALIELIKNTYDADASLCYILFDTKNDCLYIIDNGTGMSENTIQNNWMVIGTENKRIDYISEKKRIRSGEKGIGRFALDRLGSVCELYTKTTTSDNVLYWKVNWSDFEKSNQMINEVKAELEYKSLSFTEALPSCLKENLSNINAQILENFENHTNIEFNTGTIIKISSLRDDWTEKKLQDLKTSMGYLIPAIVENDEYNIVLQDSPTAEPLLRQNNIQDEYDYRVSATFTGEQFELTIYRNEYNLNIMPDKLFEEELFKNFPYRKCDFEQGYFKKTYSIQEMLGLQENDPGNLIEKMKAIGSFKFEYYFMKQYVTDNHINTFFYKPISKHRKEWLSHNYGIKLYRDNFIIRPYGEPNSDFADWLNLTSRNAADPTGIGHKRRTWKVLNSQSNGIVYISRFKNKLIADKSSREGIIDNEYYSLFKNSLIAIINKFEKDRAEIGYACKLYYDKTQEYEQAKKDADEFIKKYKREKKRKTNNNTNNANSKANDEDKHTEILVKALDARKQEAEDLLSELKLMRALSTNGLITTSIVHDLRGLTGRIASRSEQFEEFIDDKDFLQELIQGLKTDDRFLLAWITVITTQLKRDKRTRKLLNIYNAITSSTNLIKSILTQKNVKLTLTSKDRNFKSRLFQTDLDAILYNLIINSCEAFERDCIIDKEICIDLELKSDYYVIHYSDNGKGVSKSFENKYDIFKFSTTTKTDSNGNKIGLGLGMHIVATTIEEYNGKYVLVDEDSRPGFKLDIIIPLTGSANNGK